MSRLFNGTTDKASWPIGGVTGLTAWTFAMIFKSDAGVSWQSYLGCNVAGGASELAQQRHSSGNFSACAGGGANIQQGPAFSSTDGWCLLVMGRSAGTGQTIRFTKYPIGGSPAHSNSAGVMDNPVSLAGGTIRFGEIDGADFAKGRLATVAIWGSNLSDANRESLVTTMTRANWLSLSPLFLADELDAFNTDYAGTSDGVTLTGTTDDADDPTGWASWAAAGAVKAGAGIIGP